MSESSRVYVLNHSIDPAGDIGDVRLALYYTPLYCVLVTSIYDIGLAKEFAELSDIYILEPKQPVMDLAWEYAEASEMAVLVIGEAQRLDEVKKDRTKEPVCL
jgi:hypothetical protein